MHLPFQYFRKEVTAVWAWAGVKDRSAGGTLIGPKSCRARRSNVCEISGCGHDVTHLLISFERRIEFHFSTERDTQSNRKRIYYMVHIYNDDITKSYVAKSSIGIILLLQAKPHSNPYTIIIIHCSTILCNYSKIHAHLLVSIV